MIVKELKIINKAGMHTRPASTLVKIAAKYKADFFISKDGFEVNGKSIIGVMTLAAELGSTLEGKFDGPDEQDLCNEICEFFERGFDEL
ncbi:MAG: HPr family phosphocarrier protein [Bacteroidetes bacterium]|nr:HPr family phosphocarrier protein [Bacteroidota bacterium]